MKKNPFKPGYGLMPPHIAGREREQQRISSCIDTLTKGTMPQSVLLIGPRGCGKTVLLNWCERQARAQNVRLKVFSRNLPASEGELVLELLGSVFDLKNPDEVSAKVDAVIGGGESKWNLPRAVTRMKEALGDECRKQPLLVTLDEAAASDPDSLGILLSMTQSLNSQTGKVMVVIAGTPGTMDVLAKSGASFFDRSLGLSIGLLDQDAAREAIVEPLKASGMSIGRRAIDKVVEHSQGYPYFLQEWGQALFDRAGAGNRLKITNTEVKDVVDELNEIRGKIYQSRYRDWRDGDIELLGDVLNRTRIERRSGRFTRLNLRKAVEAVLREREHEGGTERADSFLRQVMHTGFLWQPLHSADLIPGLPSFVNHVLESCGHPPDQDNGDRMER